MLSAIGSWASNFEPNYLNCTIELKIWAFSFVALRIMYYVSHIAHRETWSWLTRTQIRKRMNQTEHNGKYFARQLQIL